jgi:hypothetical protein
MDDGRWKMNDSLAPVDATSAFRPTSELHVICRSLGCQDSYKGLTIQLSLHNISSELHVYMKPSKELLKRQRGKLAHALAAPHFAGTVLLL